MKTAPFAVTISRQLGSGGSYLGQRIAKHLGIYCIDREMVSESAKRLQLLEEDLADYDEKAGSFWESLLTSEYLCTSTYCPPELFMNTGSHLFRYSRTIIKKIAGERVICNK
jgi:cytidylate kinase